jgi:homoserine O-acetyltransferase/O-succinyltransferase
MPESSRNPTWRRVVVATPRRPLRLLGGALDHAELQVASWGRPDADRTNAILICHSFSTDPFFAGIDHSATEETTPWRLGKRGWWDDLIGPGKAIDTDRYWVVASAVVGGSGGSTGPFSVRTDSGKPWGIDFPWLSLGDIVEAQDRLREALGIERWKMVAGGSLGGMQALTWALAHPHRMERSVVVAAGSRPSLSGIGHFAAGCAHIRREIESGGDGYLGLLTSFGTGKRYSGPAEVASADPEWIREWPRERYHPWTYVRLAEALMTFDLAFDWGGGELKRACALAQAPLDLVSFRDDLLFTPDDIALLGDNFRQSGVEATCHHLVGSAGHDSFLTEPSILEPIFSKRL